MWLSAPSAYLPERELANDYFAELYVESPSRIARRAGMQSRRAASSSEDAGSLAICAAELAFQARSDVSPDCIDLIVSGSYTPVDTVGTIAHCLQRRFQIEKAKAIYLSTACSSFVNSLELADAFFSSGKASLALITASEHNSLYAIHSDPVSGHLWGDGAGAVLAASSRPDGGPSFEVLSIFSQGHGHVGAGPGGVFLKPKDGGLQMPNGRDVFQCAVRYMQQAAEAALESAGQALQNVRWFIPHQANLRIVETVFSRLDVPIERVIVNLDRYGNTGSASTLIGLAELFTSNTLMDKDLILLTVFGGGYSSGAALLRYCES